MRPSALKKYQKEYHFREMRVGEELGVYRTTELLIRELQLLMQRLLI